MIFQSIDCIGMTVSHAVLPDRLKVMKEEAPRGETDFEIHMLLNSLRSEHNLLVLSSFSLLRVDFFLIPCLW